MTERRRTVWLTISDETARQRTAYLDAGHHVVGRGPDCDVVLQDGQVSHHHAQLAVEAAGAWVSDLGSTNGTFVDGMRIGGPTWVPDLGEFQAGRTTVRLSIGQPAASGRVPAPTAPAAPVPPPTPPPGYPPAPGPSYHVRDAGPVAGGDVRMRGYHVAGRDLVIHEGFKLRSKMRSSAKNAIRLGVITFLAGFAMVGYFVVTWNNKIFDALQEGAAETQPDLPSPMPWLPLGFGLAFAGMTLIVVGLLIPRDRIVVPEDR
jgi:FHA domain